MAVLNRFLIGVLGAAAVVGVPGVAAAEPPPVPAPQPPPPPNVNALAPVKLSEYAVMDNNWYAFATPEGVTCVLQKANGYGCSGPIPGAPDGANLVSGSYGGVPGFANTAGNVFAAAGWFADQLPEHQLRQRRRDDDLRRQPQSVRLCDQRGRQLHSQRVASAA